ncbi:hypothetical protein Cantr_02439 [Candida viswanathii]|jgi:hypothetical protein|uniref:Uncharacterized protein n=1 Tax=Candida viswanathii TaxID=5486 RepID=A0A367YML8_9ASCO|nr:hypothetical protein Cantr_02439 [Candida viswanathii]
MSGDESISNPTVPEGIARMERQNEIREIEKYARDNGMSLKELIKTLNSDMLTHERRLELRQEALQLSSMMLKQFGKLSSIDAETAIEWKETLRKMFKTYQGLESFIREPNK